MIQDTTHVPTPFPSPLQRGISFEDVHFRYPNSSDDVLAGVTFQIQPGERVVVVGDNGSGKTTLVKCLMGLYPIQSGTIRFDDVGINAMDSKDLRKHITVVFQDFARYFFTVRDNILFGNVDKPPTDDEMRRIAKQCGIDEMIDRLEHGYDTYLGNWLAAGTDLSGGQWQRIALARALYRGGEIMVLDEPTSALDPLTELAIFQDFDRLTKGKTTLFISHRMAVAKLADKVLVMKQGKVVEFGTHQELMEQEGEYFQMYQSQANWYVNDETMHEEVAV